MSTFLHDPPAQAVVVFICFEGQVLLARKLHKIGQGLWNGYGGKVEPGESVVTCAVREVSTECGIQLDPRDLEEVGRMDCTTYADASRACKLFTMQVTIFLAHPKEKPLAKVSEEMGEPEWFPFDALPLEEMIPADQHWVPRVLAGEKIYASVHLGPGQRTTLGDPEVYRLSRIWS